MYENKFLNCSKKMFGILIIISFLFMLVACEDKIHPGEYDLNYPKDDQLILLSNSKESPVDDGTKINKGELVYKATIYLSVTVGIVLAVGAGFFVKSFFFKREDRQDF